MKTLVNSQYNPARGGHAPSDLRDAFLKTVEAVFDWSTGEPEPTVEVREREMPVSAVCGHLWNCRDVLPSGTMDGVDPNFPRQDLCDGCSCAQVADRGEEINRIGRRTVNVRRPKSLAVQSRLTRTPDVTATRVLAVNGKDDEFGNPRDRDRVVACAQNGLGIALASRWM